MSFLWHKDCRSNYMSKSKIERLRSTEMKKQSTSLCLTKSGAEKVCLSSKTEKTNWNQCIFCQEERKEDTHLIQEMKVSKKILQDAQYDQHLRIRLACTNDLTASDGRYHRSCLIKFEQISKHMQDMSDNSTDMILLWLCQELEQLAEKAKILDLTDVWDKYCKRILHRYTIIFSESSEYFQRKVSWSS